MYVQETRLNNERSEEEEELSDVTVYRDKERERSEVVEGRVVCV